MTLADLHATLQSPAPPPLPAPLLALWHDARGDWDMAHLVAQDADNEQGAWVHAYLHRKEGDAGNAAYWYRRARRPIASGSLEDEWRQIAEELLKEA